MLHNLSNHLDDDRRYAEAPISIQWFSNNVTILNATNLTHTTLPVTAANNGDVYRIDASNALNAISRTATLTVLLAPTIVDQPQSQTVVAGDNVTFSVTVTNNATLPVTYRWRRAGVSFLTNILFARTSVLTLTNVNLSQTGRYSVAITNLAGSVPVSSNALLTVLPATAPTAVTLAAAAITANGATLDASINPMGAQTVAWFDYGLTLAYGSRTSATNVGNASTAIPFAQAIIGLLPNTNYHFRVVATNYDGGVFGGDLTFQTGPPPLRISGFTLLGNGQFRLQFDGLAAAPYTVLTSTNLTDWTPLGPASETAPGHFEFTDADAPGQPQRFYQLRSP